MDNDKIIEYTKDITFSALSNANELSLNKISGPQVADFMQNIYDKLIELNAKDTP